MQKLPRYQGFERGSAGPSHRGVRKVSHNQLMASGAVSLRGFSAAAFFVLASVGKACLPGFCEKERVGEKREPGKARSAKTELDESTA